MRTYLVDGYNLLHATPNTDLTGAIDFESQRESLIARLKTLRAKRKIKIQLVFDAPRLQQSRNNDPGLIIFFAAPSADSFIRKRISENQRNPNLVVVTSDRKDIGEYAKVCGVEWITSQDFWKNWLNFTPPSSKKKNLKQAEQEGPPEGWSEADDAWLRTAFDDPTDN